MRSRLNHVLLGCLLVAAGCGGNYGQPEARDRATAASCDWYASCDAIGEGKTFATRDACEVEVRSGWNDLWPLAECDDRIPARALDSCLEAIGNTTCGNGLDFFNTVFNKCGKETVCSAEE